DSKVRRRRQPRRSREFVVGDDAVVVVAGVVPHIAKSGGPQQVGVSLAAGGAVEVASQDDCCAASEAIQLAMDQLRRRQPGCGVGVEVRGGEYQLAIVAPIAKPYPGTGARTPIVRPRDGLRDVRRVGQPEESAVQRLEAV